MTSSEIVDTHEQVERKASILETMALYNFGKGSAGRDILNEVAAMLRRLVARIEDAEAEEDALIFDNTELLNYLNAAEAALATARADALREALAAVKAARLPYRLVEGGPMAGWQTFSHEWPDTMEAAILALINKEHTQ